MLTTWFEPHQNTPGAGSSSAKKSCMPSFLIVSHKALITAYAFYTQCPPPPPRHCQIIGHHSLVFPIPLDDDNQKQAINALQAHIKLELQFGRGSECPCISISDFHPYQYVPTEYIPVGSHRSTRSMYVVRAEAPRGPSMRNRRSRRVRRRWVQRGSTTGHLRALPVDPTGGSYPNPPITGGNRVIKDEVQTRYFLLRTLRAREAEYFATGPPKTCGIYGESGMGTEAEMETGKRLWVQSPL